MRRIRYQVAASLDGFIAGPRGEYDWIPMDPEVDFGALMAQFDTWLMGRRTYEMLQSGGGGGMDGRVLVFSNTLRQEDHPAVTVVRSDDADATLRTLREQPGRDIWLYGGGSLFRSLLEIGHVDGVEVAVVPVLLGDGVPLLPSPAVRTKLTLTGQHVYRTSGIVLLKYAVARTSKPARRGRARKRA